MTAPARRTALDDGGRAIDRDELEAAVAAEAQWLRRFADAQARHALLADNGVGWAIADLALHAMRALNVPLPAYFTDAQVAHVIASINSFAG